MLQFWKKTVPKDKRNGDEQPPNPRPEPDNKPQLPLANFAELDDTFTFSKEPTKLAKTLPEVLRNKSALTYFIQYLENRSISQFGYCWLDISLFKKDCASATSPDSSPTTTSGSSGFCDASPDLTDLALAIFKKYVAIEAPSPVCCPEAVRDAIVESVCDLGSLQAGACFDQLERHVLQRLDAEFEPFLASDCFCRHQIDVLTGGCVALDDILGNETALFYFMDFLEQENGRGLLEFWIAATNLEQQLAAQRELYDPVEAQSDAVVLYDRYFSLQAHCPLGFSDRVRFLVEQSICGENGLVLNCFNLPICIVEEVLERNYLKAFLDSQLYYKYLSELIGAECGRSECGSETSFSTNGTFLAMEVNQTDGAARRRETGGHGEMSIETRLLCDPDALWKRRKGSKLSCGRVTTLGKFVTDLEPKPDRNGFKFRDVVRRIVSLDEDEKKEEMAWQVAEMIVKDITDVTMSQDKND